MSKVFNAYSVIPEKFQNKPIVYRNFDELKIKLPTNILITGETGTGKTNALYCFLRAAGAFNRIYLFAKELDEPIYKMLIDVFTKAGEHSHQRILIYGNDITKLPAYDTLDENQHNLLIIDDMITEKSRELDRVGQYFIMGRKKKCTSVFLSQSYFHVPTMIRNNIKINIFLHLPRARNLRLIMTDLAIGDLTEEQIYQLYLYATKEGFPNFFLIDACNPDPNYRYRKNFTPIPWKALLHIEEKDD